MSAILAQSSVKRGEYRRVSELLKKKNRKTQADVWGSPSSYHFVETVRRFMARKRVQAFWLVCIVLNAAYMILEEQYYGARMGYDLGYYETTGSDRYPDFERFLRASEILFALLFTVEVALLLIAMKSLFWYDWRCVLDFVVVVLTDLTLVFDQVLNMDYNIQVLRLMRLTRMTRFLKLMKTVENLDAINVMAAALQRCLASAFWAVVVLFVSLTVFALCITSIVRYQYLTDNDNMTDDQKGQFFVYFGSYTRSMLSMFELALANWTVIGRFLMENVHEWWALIIILFKLTIGFAMIGILNSVFMQETFSATELDNDIMVAKKRRADEAHRSKMMDLFELADSNGDGLIGRRNFAELIQDPSLRLWISSMGLDVSNGSLLFDLIANGKTKTDGRIDKEEFIAGTASLRGPARSIDVRALRKRLESA